MISNFLGKKIRELRKKRIINKLKKRGLKLGKNVKIVGDFFFDPSHCYLITIDDNCVICPNVRIIAHDASTKGFIDYTRIGKVHIKRNCFIGDSAIILPGVYIGPNSIVGAGSVVTKDIPPFTVAAGNPARVIYSLQEYLIRMEEFLKLNIQISTDEDINKIFEFIKDKRFILIK